MRRVTRNAVVVILLILVGLLALGALPGMLGSGDPYYVTAERVNASDSAEPRSANSRAAEPRDAADASGGSAASRPTTGNASAAVNATVLSERRFPYTTEALRNGTSAPYRKGPWGLKEAFTHSPFDELGALEARNASAVTEAGVLVRDNGTLYRVAVGQRP